MKGASTEPAARTRRPEWAEQTPDLALDCRSAGHDGTASLREVMKEAERLRPGQVLAVLIGFEPTFLCRVLAGKGIEHWSEPAAGDDWIIRFSRRRGGRERLGSVRPR